MTLRRSETETYVVIDVGATRTEAGFGGWKERPEPVDVKETPDTCDGLIEMLRSFIDELVNEARSSGRDVSAVAVGVPGLVDNKGKLVDAPHTSFGNLKLSDELDLNVPVVVENDANAQSLGCARRSGTDCLCYVTLGTGIGGGIIQSGELVRGMNGFAGEVGHMRVPSSSSPDRLCACGQRGCLETVASGEYLRASLGDSWWERELTPNEVSVVKHAGEAVGEAVTILAVLNNPESVIVTGKLATRDSFLTGMKEAWNHPWTDFSLKMYEDSWQFAREGLTKLVRRATEK